MYKNFLIISNNYDFQNKDYSSKKIVNLHKNK